MMLNELTVVPVAALPVQAMKDHLRLGSGFSDDGMQDALIEGYLRAAIAAVEGRIGKVLLARTFRWVLESWRGTAAQALPVAPVTTLVSVTLVDSGGGSVPVDPARLRLVADTHRPRVASVGTALPTIPTDGRVEIVFEAGFGAAWTEVPADLRQAVMLLAAEFHEHRDKMGQPAATLPFGIVSLIERWRNVRVLGGGMA